MTGKDYQRDAMRTNDGKCSYRMEDVCYRLRVEFDNEETLDTGEIINAVFGLTGESGEVADMVKKWIFHDHNLDVGHLEKELGDVMWYVALMCHAIGTDMDAVMEKNVAKLKARYPDGFDPERSQNRKDGDV